MFTGVTSWTDETFDDLEAALAGSEVLEVLDRVGRHSSVVDEARGEVVIGDLVAFRIITLAVDVKAS